MSDATTYMYDLLTQDRQHTADAVAAMTQTYYDGPYEVTQSAAERAESLEEYVRDRVPTGEFIEEVDWAQLASMLYNPDNDAWPED
jgi:hypothetical protein